MDGCDVDEENMLAVPSLSDDDFASTLEWLRQRCARAPLPSSPLHSLNSFIHSWRMPLVKRTAHVRGTKCRRGPVSYIDGSRLLYHFQKEVLEQQDASYRTAKGDLRSESDCSIFCDSKSRPPSSLERRSASGTISRAIVQNSSAMSDRNSSANGRRTNQRSGG